METHPDSPLIDGALPRSSAERVAILLDYAGSMIPGVASAIIPASYPGATVGARYSALRQEYETASAGEISRPPLVHPENEYEHWHELEDDVIGLVNDLLDEPWYTVCEGGDVLIVDSSEEGEG